MLPFKGGSRRCGAAMCYLHYTKIWKLYADNLSGGGVFDFHMGSTTKFQKNKMAEGKLPPTSSLRLHKNGWAFEMYCIIKVLQPTESTYNAEH